MSKTLQQIVTQHPLPDFADWWQMGNNFCYFMAGAIVTEWQALPGESTVAQVQSYVAEYIQTVYQRVARRRLAETFVANSAPLHLASGEFDALSYAFFRSAYERIADQPDAFEHSVARERRLFTMRVGERFFNGVAGFLALKMPASLTTTAQFTQLQTTIQQIGEFLQAEGYLRDHFVFRFDVDTHYQGREIQQTSEQFLPHLNKNGVAYALYEMGYPAILPSAIYLYHTIGEAQHHSSRTIEQLFARVGRSARETDDFDPTGYPSELVVELWEIR